VAEIMRRLVAEAEAALSKETWTADRSH